MLPALFPRDRLARPAHRTLPGTGRRLGGKEVVRRVGRHAQDALRPTGGGRRFLRLHLRDGGHFPAFPACRRAVGSGFPGRAPARTPAKADALLPQLPAAATPCEWPGKNAAFESHAIVGFGGVVARGVPGCAVHHHHPPPIQVGSIPRERVLPGMAGSLAGAPEGFSGIEILRAAGGEVVPAPVRLQQKSGSAAILLH